MTETAERLFEWLISYHIERNLQACLPHIRDGRFYQHGRPLAEGRENEHYQGVLIVANGDTLFNRMIDAGMIEDGDHDAPVTVTSKEEFFGYLDGQDNSDGAYIFDGVHSTFTRVNELHNGIARGLHSLVSHVPKDFASYDEGLDARRFLGTKTRLAIKIPYQFPDVHALQVKRSGYTDLGLGKVTKFNSSGLEGEFFLKADPESVGPFIDVRNSIVGVRRSYGVSDGGLVLTDERPYVPRGQQGYRASPRRSAAVAMPATA